MIPELEISVIVLHDKDGRVLLHKRKGEDETDVKDHWLLVGGKIEEGESAEDAIRREVREELGYELSAPRFHSTQEFHTEGKARGKRHIFIEEHDTARPLASLESFLLDWVHPLDIHKIETLEAVREIIHTFGTGIVG